jgi:predicted DNA-binding transcriptional regulator YafY
VSSQLVRQWRILALIPKVPPGIDVVMLEARLFASGIAVHRRTIQRDLVELAKVFPLIQIGAEKPYKWRWSDEARFLCSIPILEAPDEPGAEIALRLRVERSAARYVVEGLRGGAAAARDVTCVNKDKKQVEVLARVVDACTLRRWLLGFADSIEVLAPAHVRAELGDAALRVAERHRSRDRADDRLDHRVDDRADDHEDDRANHHADHRAGGRARKM